MLRLLSAESLVLNDSSILGTLRFALRRRYSWWLRIRTRADCFALPVRLPECIGPHDVPREFRQDDSGRQSVGSQTNRRDDTSEKVTWQVKEHAQRAKVASLEIQM